MGFDFQYNKAQQYNGLMADSLRVFCKGALGLVIEKAKTVAATTA